MNPTYEQAATNYELWCEYVDPYATMTEEQFNQMSVAEKVQTQIDIWGTEEADENEDQ